MNQTFFLQTYKLPLMSRVQVRCRNCGRVSEVDSQYFQVFGDDFFCENCLVHTQCASCDRGLRISPEEFQSLGGDPLYCKGCSQNRRIQKNNESNEKNTTSGSSYDVVEIIGLVALITLSVAVLLYPGNEMAIVNSIVYDIQQSLAQPGVREGAASVASTIILIFIFISREK